MEQSEKTNSTSDQPFLDLMVRLLTVTIENNLTVNHQDAIQVILAPAV
uniref:Uncharacterized protein n=1 Tax=Tetranychus urticae TaxID=32264 RepID=T1K7F2_TETUR